MSQPRPAGSPSGEPEPRAEQQARAEGDDAPRPDAPRPDAPRPDAARAAQAAVQADEEADEQALEGDVDELVAVAAQRDDYLALAQRTQADFENYRKRVARESRLAIDKGTAKLVKELLPALDSLDRALEGAAQDDPLLEGVRLVRAEIHAALARVGVESFLPQGERFDPTCHEAMAQRESDGHDSGSVVEVYQPGYRIGESIIRPARVVVAA
jgi:molecular chaperone GrpE